jgi:predicted HicB family RNase H-like nuclease
MSVRKKTVLRTIRIAEDLDILLQEEAKRRRTSVNAMVGGMLEKFGS